MHLVWSICCCEMPSRSLQQKPPHWFGEVLQSLQPWHLVERSWNTVFRCFYHTHSKQRRIKHKRSDKTQRFPQPSLIRCPRTRSAATRMGDGWRWWEAGLQTSLNFVHIKVVWFAENVEIHFWTTDVLSMKQNHSDMAWWKINRCI